MSFKLHFSGRISAAKLHFSGRTSKLFAIFFGGTSIFAFSNPMSKYNITDTSYTSAISI